VWARCGHAVLGEDEHRGPTRFPLVADVSLRPRTGARRTSDCSKLPDSTTCASVRLMSGSGSSIQSRQSERRFVGAKWCLRLIAGAGLHNSPSFLPLCMAFATKARWRSRAANGLASLGALRATVPICRIRTGGPNSFGCLITSCCVQCSPTCGSQWVNPLLRYNFKFQAAFACQLWVRSVRHRALSEVCTRTAGRSLPPAMLVTIGA